jgi:lantibiotic transport system ATP-binding protein
LTPTTSAAIETHDLTRRFGDRTVVDHASFTVTAGSVYGFLGPNGAGKTTTIRMLLGLIRPQTGSYEVFGSAAPGGRESLARIGSLVETPSLYPHLSAVENLEVTRRLLGSARVPKSAIDRVLQVVRLQDPKDSRRLVREYSLGMRQRLGLALALLHAPSLLILDEPTNGLDPAGIHEMRDLLRRMPTEHGVTVFLSSHLLGEVEQIASHVCIIHLGRILFQGTLEELRARGRKRDSLVPATSATMRIGVRGGRAGEALRFVDGGTLSGEDCIEAPIADANHHEAAAASVNAKLCRAGFEVFHVSVQSPQMQEESLESVFLSMTANHVSH